MATILCVAYIRGNAASAIKLPIQCDCFQWQPFLCSFYMRFSSIVCFCTSVFLSIYQWSSNRWVVEWCKKLHRRITGNASCHIYQDQVFCVVISLAGRCGVLCLSPVSSAVGVSLCPAQLFSSFPRALVIFPTDQPIQAGCVGESRPLDPLNQAFKSVSDMPTNMVVP